MYNNLFPVKKTRRRTWRKVVLSMLSSVIFWS